MPNYNTQLQSNNTDLQAILNTINELPEAGSGAQATPEISVNSTNGLITATAGAKSSTYQMAFQPAKTITPSTTSQIAISSGYYTGGNITVAGDANLVAGNIKSGVSIFGVNGTLESGGSVDGNYYEIIHAMKVVGDKAFMSCSNLTTVSFPNVSKIGVSAFTNCSNLTTASFPKATTISSYAFGDCSNLTTVSFPAATTIGSEAFTNCTNLTTVSFPKATTINVGAFGDCSNLTTVSFPAATTIGSVAFGDCSNLTTVSFPAATTIGSRAFMYCTNLTTVSFPAATTINFEAFTYCTNLTTVSFPAATTIGSSAFGSCSNLTTASFPNVTTIGSSAFFLCYNLKSLYLMGPSVCKLSHSDAFTSTPINGYKVFEGNYGSIYVPASLLTQYQTATNWAYFSSRFVGI